MHCKKIIPTILFFITFINYAQQIDSLRINTQTFKINNKLSYEYSKPVFFDMIRYIPKNISNFGKFIIKKENSLVVGGALTSTVMLIPYDQRLTDGASKLGNNFGWDQDAKYSKVAGIFPIIPNKINSAVYYIGNGGTTLLLGGVFYVIGKTKKDYRALNTANELVEVLFSVGLLTQSIKRITGRQSPNRAIESCNPGGAWKFFPKFKQYQRNTPNFDAMPSGHLATFMATITVISTNYPEIKWIKPVGYSMMGLLAFQMVSGKVHWTSDYPIALLMGYVIGKHTAKRRIIEHHQLAFETKKTNYKTDYCVSNLHGDLLVGLQISF